LALYGLILFWNGASELLQPFNPLLKFVLVKTVVFLTFWQVGPDSNPAQKRPALRGPSTVCICKGHLGTSLLCEAHLSLGWTSLLPCLVPHWVVVTTGNKWHWHNPQLVVCLASSCC
jgi:hypothetical protein